MTEAVKPDNLRYRFFFSLFFSFLFSFFLFSFFLVIFFLAFFFSFSFLFLSFLLFSCLFSPPAALSEAVKPRQYSLSHFMGLVSVVRDGRLTSPAGRLPPYW